MFNKWELSSIVLLVSMTAVGAQKPDAFSLPNSVLLFGNYNNLWVVAPEWTQHIQPPVDLKYNGGYFAYPSLSPRGDIVAWGFATEARVTPGATRIRFALGLYSIADRRWKTHGEFEDIGNTAYSPSASKIAFVARRQEAEELTVFDVATESLTKAPYPKAGLRTKSNISWSPDEKSLALEIPRGGLTYHPDMPMAESNRNPVIGILEITTGALRTFGEGRNPAWSRNGDWIAYYDVAGKSCLLIRPDGADLKTVATAPPRGGFGGTAPVWSPDGTLLLLNVVKDGRRGIDVVLLDLVTGQMTTKSESGQLVFGWVPYPPKP
jgi:hypothetical protein